MKIKLTRKGEILRDILIGILLAGFMLFISVFDSLLNNLFTP